MQIGHSFRYTRRWTMLIPLGGAWSMPQIWQATTWWETSERISRWFEGESEFIAFGANNLLCHFIKYLLDLFLFFSVHLLLMNILQTFSDWLTGQVADEFVKRRAETEWCVNFFKEIMTLYLIWKSAFHHGVLVNFY